MVGQANSPENQPHRKDTPQLNLDFLLSPLAWNNSVSNLSSGVCYFFIGLLRDISSVLLACEIIIPTVNL